ncbi:hypothetical protein KIN20_022525 [Parelaphostrongylus tenuis]|uniref:ubiquitinyl hydrolase 1 n=1 Tax=Parelaphostrongylus tenuis TaxID=148309 RepID=A0AAD5QSB4_PARTN|nr:hypothetical protein KIN20_022525 [Parelaphostrongylus tenuis]
MRPSMIFTNTRRILNAKCNRLLANFTRKRVVVVVQMERLMLMTKMNYELDGPQFTSESLDEICYALNGSRWFNPHRSFFGLGNYDVNVLMSVLDKYDFQRTSAILPEFFYIHLKNPIM